MFDLQHFTDEKKWKAIQNNPQFWLSIIFVGFCVLIVFAIIREFWCWYWKTSAIAGKLIDISAKMDVMRLEILESRLTMAKMYKEIVEMNRTSLGVHSTLVETRLTLLDMHKTLVETHLTLVHTLQLLGQKAEDTKPDHSSFTQGITPSKPSLPWNGNGHQPALVASEEQPPDAVVEES